MSYQTFATIVLAAGAGFCIPHLWNFLTWQRGKYRRKADEW